MGVKKAVKPTRSSYERQVLELFDEVLSRHGMQGSRGQGKKNRISLGENGYFQFGDMRVETAKRYIVVEVESSGGVTNLAKYRYCLEHELIDKPLVLFHIFRTTSKRDYAAHIELWKLIKQHMAQCFPGKFTAYRPYTYNPERLRKDLTDALSKFEHLLVD